MSKTCSKCLVSFEDLDANFCKQKLGQGGYRANCKACGKKGHDVYYAKNKEAILEKNRKRKQAHPDKEKARKARYDEENREKNAAYRKQYRLTHKEELTSKYAEYVKQNPDIRNARCAKRRASKLQAAVAWANKDAILAFYTHAAFLSGQRGVKYHVDHIHPLDSKLICGFDVESNLKVMLGTENISKGNKFTQYGFDFTSGFAYELTIDKQEMKQLLESDY